MFFSFFLPWRQGRGGHNSIPITLVWDGASSFSFPSKTRLAFCGFGGGKGGFQIAKAKNWIKLIEIRTSAWDDMTAGHVIRLDRLKKRELTHSLSYQRNFRNSAKSYTAPVMWMFMTRTSPAPR